MFRYKFLSMVILAGMLVTQTVPHAIAATLCDSAQFVSDLTIPDGTSLAPGANFTKTWRLSNNGTCTWSTSYTVVWVGGDQMGTTSVKIPVNVPPGQMVDISVNLTAPAAAGHYKSLWKLSNPSGTQFGIGNTANDAFWVDINVLASEAIIYDFVANAPYAQWKSGAGLLPYPGASGDSRGYSFQVDKPHLEDDSYDTLPGLLTVPQNKYNGYIQATYPEFQIQTGDKLQTLVNCEFGATNCYVTFRIDYLLPNGVQKTLWQWKEAPDKRFYRANLDLSALTGQKVRFVFMLLSSGFASGDRAIWGSPRIVRTGTVQPPAPPSTLTPLPPLPATATPITPPPPTVSPAGCDRATFVADVTVQDGTQFAPGAAFTKTWRLKNSGSCIWTTAYKLIYYSGELMSAPTTVNLPWGATYDQTVDVSVNMVAPSNPGSYRGYWILANASGKHFGIGADASKPVWVDIKVAGEPTYEDGYKLWMNACSAEWKSGAGILPCPGTETDRKGFIIPQQHTQLEDGTMGPAPSLLVAPENRYNGYIMGTFPTFTVQPGDRFVTGVGCEYNHSCYVTFRLDYMTATGYIGTFWQWREQNDKRNYTADVDLTPLAGRSVRFILTILATGSATGDRARWVGPSILRKDEPKPPTITPIPQEWLLYTNQQYGVQFKYPPQAQITDQSNTYLKMKLPIAPGTNLFEKYLETVVVENANPCRSPLAASGLPRPPETVTINGISFLKESAEEGAAGSLYEWVAYSAVHNNACISMQFVLHSHHTGVFATPPTVFDKAAESAVFLQMMNTFDWTTPTITITPPTVSPPIASPTIRSLHMVDAMNGWALTDLYVLRTYDSGTTWYNVLFDSVPPGGFFASADKAWVISHSAETSVGSLYRTINGGQSWTRYDVPFNSGILQFLDDNNGFVLYGLGSGMQKQAVALYQTTDGGATWTLKYDNAPTAPNPGTSLPFSGHKNGMTFRDTTTGWVGGDYPADGFVYLYKTTDAGLSWSQVLLPLPAGYESAYITTTAPEFFGANDAVLPVWMTVGVGMRDLFLYTTHDGGATWTASPAFARNAEHTEIISLVNTISWNWGNFFHVTGNSGSAWTTVTPNVPFGDSFRELDFVSANTGWARVQLSDGHTALYRTNDGGITWTKLYGHSDTPEPQPLPDLTITEMRIELQNTACLDENSTMGVRVWIRNNGNSMSPPFVVRVNGMDQTANRLGIGESTILFFPGADNPVTVTLDATSVVQESDETNNTRSEMVAIPTPPLPCVTPASLAQDVVTALNTRNFDVAKSKMGSSFSMAFWQSQGTSYPPDAAIQQVQSYMNANTVLTADPNKDLTSILGGSNPYSVMGLDPSTSLALFVSGWGPDAKDEAILYVARSSNGTLYWHGLLIAPGGFARFQITPTPLQGPYAVIRVAPGDVLNIRAGAGINFAVVGSYPPDATNVMLTGLNQTAEGAEWVQVQKDDGTQGWVNSYYLTEYVTHEAFCADQRIPVLLEQLKYSMNQSNGEAFAALVNPKHGVNVHLWAYANGINYTTTTARNIFTSTESYNWGAGPRGEPDVGTFQDLLQPKLQDVLNAPTKETYCDDLARVFPLYEPWKYGNIRYYNLYRPSSTPADLDFRTWLIGFEYINGQPYLHAMVTIQWEP